MRTACGSSAGGGWGLFPEAGRALDFPLLLSLDCSTDLSNGCSLEGNLQREAETPGFPNTEPWLWMQKVWTVTAVDCSNAGKPALGTLRSYHITLIYCVCACLYAYLCLSDPLEVRGQLAEVRFLLLPCGSWIGFRLSGLAEPSHWP